MSDPNKVKELGDALSRLQARHGQFKWHGSFAEVAVLVAQVQLALRHPANRGHAAGLARGVIEAWIATLESQEPAAGLLRLGFDPAHDVTRTKDLP